MEITIKKYAWLPKHVNTWRPNGTTAIIWFQSYYVKTEKHILYNCTIKNTYCLHLGFFSYEFY